MAKHHEEPKMHKKEHHKKEEPAKKGHKENFGTAKKEKMAKG